MENVNRQLRKIIKTRGHFPMKEVTLRTRAVVGSIPTAPMENMARSFPKVLRRLQDQYTVARNCCKGCGRQART